MIRQLLLLVTVAVATAGKGTYPVPVHGSKEQVSVESVSFLVTVNDTWWPSEQGGGTCMKTVKTPPIRPNQPWNESESVEVGKCDHGPLAYTLTNISPGGQSSNHTYIEVVFYSSVIEDASHPSCKIEWDYTYLTPSSPTPRDSLLPGCFVMDSREGYHMTYYWFHALDWTLKE